MTKDEALKLALEALEINLPIAYAKNGRGERFPCFSDDPLREIKTREAITLLRQALDHVPDTTKMLEPDMGIDRGAWADVPDATKWVDELRGGDETEQEPVAFVCRGKLSTIGHCEECKPLYTAPTKREWVGLTSEEITKLKHLMDHKSQWSYIEFADAIEAKLKEKNRE